MPFPGPDDQLFARLRGNDPASGLCISGCEALHRQLPADDVKVIIFVGVIVP